MRGLLLLLLLWALPSARSQPCPAGSYCPSAGVALPCTCPAACPAARLDYAVDATLSGAQSTWSTALLAGSGGWSGSDADGTGAAATFNNPSSMAHDLNAYASHFPPAVSVRVRNRGQG